MQPAPQPVAPGALIGERYQTEGVLGQGGFGVVYAARDLTMGRSVALKVLRPDLFDKADAAPRFRREAELALRLEHPHTVRLRACRRRALRGRAVQHQRGRRRDGRRLRRGEELRARGPLGLVSVNVTFAPDGRATNVFIGTAYRTTPGGKCIEAAFKSAKVSPFNSDKPASASKSYMF